MSLSFDPNSIDLPLGHHIGGEMISAEGVLEMRRPSDNVHYTDCPIADAALVDRAVETAQTAFKTSGWATCHPRDRVRAMHRWADLIEANAVRLAQLEALCSTRPVGQLIKGDIANTADQIRFFAEMTDKEGSPVVPTRGDQMGMIVSEPYGVIGAITPWNFPISMAAWKLGPALAAGNAVVLKPSEMTPFSTLYLAELAIQAGIPSGLINIVLGDGPTTGTALTGHPGIGKISFTGSTVAGAAIMANIAKTGIKPMTLELGGKSPQVVFADADLEQAANAIAGNITANAGQACVAGSRVIVEASVKDAFVAALVSRMSNVTPNPTWEETSKYSPIISKKQIGRMDGIVQNAIAQGAEAVCGGTPFDHEGCFYKPTVLTDVTETSPAIQEEIFGPVLTVQSFTTEDEAMQLADHPTYGLAAGLFTQNLSRGLRLMKRLEAGTVWINRYGRTNDHILPTGGYKASGIGKDLGREAFLASHRTKSVLVDL